MCAKGASEKNLAYLVAGSCPRPRQFYSVKSLSHRPLQGLPLHDQMMEVLLFLHAEGNYYVTPDAPGLQCLHNIDWTADSIYCRFGLCLIHNWRTVVSCDYSAAPVF